MINLEFWKKPVAEMLMVMLGVFLALLADEWREQRQIDEIIVVTETRIINEIHGNYEELLQFQSDFESRMERVTAWGNMLDTTLSIGEQFDSFPGIPTRSFNDAAWQRANSSQFTGYIDEDLIEDAYPLHAGNQNLRIGVEGILDIYFSVELWDESLTRTNFLVIESMFQESISQIRQAVEAYRLFTEKYPLREI